MQTARTTDIVELFERTGYTVVKKGSYYSLKEVPHIMAKGRCRYYDNYKRQQGDAITFLQDYCNMSFSDAVKYLLDYQGKTWEKPPSSARPDRTSPKEEKEEFILPEPSADHRRVYAYLKKRGIASQVIGVFLSSGLLYEDAEHHNCIFVGKNTDGTAVFAYKRGTYDKDGTGFKGDEPGSDKDIAFRLPCDPGMDIVHVFESPVDLMSFMTLHRDIISNAVALCCLHDGALETYLKENTNIKTIVLCLDNDEWGRKAAARLTEKYTGRGYRVYDPIPPSGKDWNEYVQIKKSQKKERTDAR